MRLAGYVFFAGALTFVFHAYEPGSFDAVLPVDFTAAQPSPSLPPQDPRPTRNFALTDGPTLKSLDERAAVRNARSAESDMAVAVALPVAVAELPVAPAVTAVEVRPAPAPLSALAPTDTAGKAALVRNIKRELRRVGCFSGQIDDEWDAGVRYAVDSFMDRVNATLPNRPDHVLLTLVRNHGAAACSATCPRGQSMSGEGRCMPDAIVAKMTRASPAPVAQRKAPVVEPFTTTVTMAEVRTTAAKATPPGVAVADAPAKKTPPLPGRMAMGAPGSAGETSSGSWWDSFMQPAAPEPAKEQTLDRPVGLTHVPAPQPAQRRPTRQDLSATEFSAPNGGPALQPANITTGPIVERPRGVKGGRANRSRSARKPARARERSARRWGGGHRNVQVMFQHPLGRM